MRPTVEAAVDHFLGQAHEGVPWDVVPGLCEPLAITTILAHLGIPSEGWQPVRQWSAAIMQARTEGGDHPDVIRAAAEARERMLDYLATIAERRDVPDEQKGPRDVLGTLLDAVDDEDITPDEMLMMLIHISMAGNGPLAMAISNVIRALEQHPDVRRRVIDDPDLVPTAVEEILRWDSATHYVVRFALDDIKMWNRTIREGQMVYVMVGAANRDPAKFDDPDAIRLGRSNNRHLTFGMGIHYCLGTPLAKIELDVATRRILERWGEYRVVNAQRGGSLQVRGYGKLELLPHNA
jgi:cytochrome P450